MPTNKLLKMQQLALSLLQKRTVMSHWVMSLGKANFCANGHAQLHHLCCVIQNGMLTVIILLFTYFVLVIFLFQLCINLWDCLNFKSIKFCLQVSLSDVVMNMDAMFCHWTFYFLDSGLILSIYRTWAGSEYNVHIPFQRIKDSGPNTP